jgi:hypothetical protein
VTCPDVKYVDVGGSGSFNVGDRLYRDEDANGVVGAVDTLLSVGPATGVVVGNVHPDDLASAAPLTAVPPQVKFVDLIREPPSVYQVGYPSVVGMTAVSANDLFAPSIAFPIHGLSPAVCSNAIVVDDASQYLPGFEMFETQLVGHEFGHGLCLNHGDGFDDDGNGVLDDEDDPTAPVPGARPGTLCDTNNLMQYCWRDDGTPGNPSLVWIGVGAPTTGTLTDLQVEVVRNEAMTIPDVLIDPVPLPLEAAREDHLGELPVIAAYLDIASFNVKVDVERNSTAFGLVTRGAFPQVGTAVPLISAEFDFALDADGNATTGGSPRDVGVPGELAGAEIVGIVKVPASGAKSTVTTTVYKYNGVTKAFEPATDRSIVGAWRTLQEVIDFAGAPHRPFAEEVTLTMSNAVRGALSEPFRVEYVAHTGNLTDRALAEALDFRLPVFPTCEVEPRPVRAGEQAIVRSAGLLPNHAAHVFLGPVTVANATTTANGTAVVPFTVPPNTATGKHLVTIGTIAVTGDCLLPVEGKRDEPRPQPENGTAPTNDTVAPKPKPTPGPGLLAIAGVVGIAVVLRQRRR